MTTVLKIGGSVITEKDRPETIDHERLDRATRAIAEISEPLVLVHGAGSFGHHHADKHGVSVTDGTQDATEIRAIHGSMKRLSDAVLDALSEAGVSAIPVHPLSAAHRTADGSLRLGTDTVATMLGESFVPVLHGDVVVRGGRGGTIISGDELVAALARALSADRVGVCSSVSAVYDVDGDPIDRIESFDDVADAVGKSDATDVTGGMAGKVEQLLSLDAPAYVFDLDDLATFVSGGDPGTRIE